MISVELTPPGKDPYMPFEDNFRVREEYVKLMIKSLKNKYQRAMENYEWEIMLVVEEEEVFEPQLN